jgi:hypothetical protein
MHLKTNGSLAHARYEILDNLKVDIGFEQRQAHFAERSIHIGRAEHAPFSQVVENVL